MSFIAVSGNARVGLGVFQDGDTLTVSEPTSFTRWRYTDSQWTNVIYKLYNCQLKILLFSKHAKANEAVIKSLNECLFYPLTRRTRSEEGGGGGAQSFHSYQIDLPNHRQNPRFHRPLSTVESSSQAVRAPENPHTHLSAGCVQESSWRLPGFVSDGSELYMTLPARGTPTLSCLQVHDCKTDPKAVGPFVTESTSRLPRSRASRDTLLAIFTTAPP